MEGLAISLWPLTAWHWLALGLLLISIEMAIGTFDLLWISIAAGFTSLYASFAPASMNSWQAQVLVFALASVALFILGRTVFQNMRDNGEEHPTLNKRMASTVGSQGAVESDFVDGQGRVKLGDTAWSAQTIDGSSPSAGAPVIVEETNGNILRVKTL